MVIDVDTQEAMWLRQLLSDLVKDYELSVPTTIYEDNQSAICMTRNNQSHGRSKHVDIKYHFVREQVEKETIKAIYCKSEEMTADILTKGAKLALFLSDSAWQHSATWMVHKNSVNTQGVDPVFSYQI